MVGTAISVFNSDCLVSLTIGKTVLQPIEPTVGKKGPRSQSYFQEMTADELDDTPVMESVAEGYGYVSRQGEMVQQCQGVRFH